MKMTRGVLISLFLWLIAVRAPAVSVASPAGNAIPCLVRPYSMTQPDQPPDGIEALLRGTAGVSSSQRGMGGLLYAPLAPSWRFPTPSTPTWFRLIFVYSSCSGRRTAPSSPRAPPVVN
ncbi:MAG TPA: hypothetical protein VKU00_23040 [Chthonomonadaceae bacterium]|nr:hypothetical protein [Chthonomonadaceae bacterium]